MSDAENEHDAEARRQRKAEIRRELDERRQALFDEQDRREASEDRRREWRSEVTTATVSQTVSTLLAAAVIYLLAVAAGYIKDAPVWLDIVALAACATFGLLVWLGRAASRFGRQLRVLSFALQEQTAAVHGVFAPDDGAGDETDDDE
jgi:Flp pilus assembly protein TadB